MRKLTPHSSFEGQVTVQFMVQIRTFLKVKAGTVDYTRTTKRGVFAQTQTNGGPAYRYTGYKSCRSLEDRDFPTV